MSEKIVLRGVRPAALEAVSERERLRAHPHRAQAAVNHARALAGAAVPPAAVEPQAEEPQAEARGAKKRGRR